MDATILGYLLLGLGISAVTAAVTVILNEEGWGHGEEPARIRSAPARRT